MEVLHFPELTSTNSHARELVAQGKTGPLWVMADMQTAGRGRLQRRWVSEPGNLFCTGLYPALPKPHAQSELSFVAALAVQTFISDIAPESDVKLKWPNDVLLTERKVSGILLENLDSAVICGIGVNLTHHPETDRWPATNLSEHTSLTPRDALDRLIEAFGHYRDRLIADGFDAIRALWTDRAYGIGQTLTVSSGGRPFAGTFAGLGPNGELMLRTSTGTVPIVAGDVTYGGR